MSILQAWQQVVHHGRHMLTPEQVTLLTSAGMQEAAAAADDSSTAKAAFMLETLRGVSLDPLHGTAVEHFVIDGPDSWAFCLQFDRLSHFVLSFSVPKKEEIGAQLVTQVLLNLNSRKFKAAAALRRLERSRRLQRLHDQMQERGNAARRAYLSAHLRGGETRAEAQAVYDGADALHEQETAARRAQLDRRRRSLTHAASPALADRGYTQWVADVLCRVLPLQRALEAA
ncbi:hypothetical protein [Methylibium petroleiphilum]|uniref:Uncharacterized protein n=1 Tax=Methylibium petroleiphilum (strain ATCC BAA-1232 / LMG 22953 / PM1) TaxID=420662 RepID=A2SNE1_METPP|nr:hypothetical protein [Methylibium petroleiphilum]ABM97080.1 hypothetical protein Mpe_B0305 [Methylibium petroleiphilum PM1]